MAVSNADIFRAARNAGFSEQDSVTMTAIALAESSGNPDAIGDGGNSFGLWQIHRPSNPELFQGNVNWRDPNTNAGMARAVFNKQGFRAWTQYKFGVYLLYMRVAGAARLDANANQAVDNVRDAIQGPIDAVNQTGEAVGQAVGFLSQGRNWGRIGIISLGAILLIVAATVIAIPVVTPAVKAAKKVVK